MKKKFFILCLVVILMLLSTSVAFSDKKFAVFTQWTWPPGMDKSGFFMTTGSELVHMWSYDKPGGEPDIHFVIKPLDKFPDAECDSGAIKDSPTWKPRNLYNVTWLEYKAAFKTVFPNLDRLYHLCGYAID